MEILKLLGVVAKENEGLNLRYMSKEEILGLDNWNGEKSRRVIGNMKISSLYEEGRLGLLFKEIVLF